MVFDGPGKRLDLYFDGKRLPRVPQAITVDGKREVVDKRPADWQIIPAGDDEPLRMGQLPYYSSDPFHAQSMDEVAIWNPALSDEEIKTLDDNGHGAAPPIRVARFKLPLRAKSIPCVSFTQIVKEQLASRGGSSVNKIF
jgi:hypothetical protein